MAHDLTSVGDSEERSMEDLWKDFEKICSTFRDRKTEISRATLEQCIALMKLEQAPSTQRVFKVRPSGVGAYYHRKECEKYLVNEGFARPGKSEPRSSQTSSLSAESSAAATAEARFKRGEKFENQVWEELKTKADDTIVCIDATDATPFAPGDGGHSFRNYINTILHLNEPHDASYYYKTFYLYQAPFSEVHLGTTGTTRITTSKAKPDILVVSFVEARQTNEGSAPYSVRVTVADVKHSAAGKVSHQAQLAVYCNIIQRNLEGEHDGKIEVSDVGEIWLPRVKSLTGEKSVYRIEKIELAPVKHSVRRVLAKLEDPQFFENPNWALSASRCSGCSYLEKCREEAKGTRRALQEAAPHKNPGATLADIEDMWKNNASFREENAKSLGCTKDTPVPECVVSQTKGKVIKKEGADILAEQCLPQRCDNDIVLSIFSGDGVGRVRIRAFCIENMATKTSECITFDESSNEKDDVQTFLETLDSFINPAPEGSLQVYVASSKEKFVLQKLLGEVFLRGSQDETNLPMLKRIAGAYAHDSVECIGTHWRKEDWFKAAQTYPSVICLHQIAAKLFWIPEIGYPVEFRGFTIVQLVNEDRVDLVRFPYDRIAKCRVDLAKETLRFLRKQFSGGEGCATSVASKCLSFWPSESVFSELLWCKEHEKRTNIAEKCDDVSGTKKRILITKTDATTWSLFSTPGLPSAERADELEAQRTSFIEPADFRSGNYFVFWSGAGSTLTFTPTTELRPLNKTYSAFGPLKGLYRDAKDAGFALGDLFSATERLPRFENTTTLTIKDVGKVLLYGSAGLSADVVKRMPKGTVLSLYPRYCDMNSPKVTDSLMNLSDAFETAQPNDPSKFLHTLLTKGPASANTGCGCGDNLCDDERDDELTPSQMRAYSHFTRHRIQLVWGPPGTGKTFYLAHAIVRWMKAQKKQKTEGEGYTIAVTSVAKDAFAEVIGKVRNIVSSWKGVDIILQGEAEPSSISTFVVHGLTVWQAEKTAECYDMIVIDEGSQMPATDATLMLTKLKEGGRLIVAGDHLQLPPIQPEIKREVKGRAEANVCSSILLALMRKRNNDPAAVSDTAELHCSVVKLTDNMRSNATITSHTQRLYGKDYRVPENAGDRRLLSRSGTSALQESGVLQELYKLLERRVDWTKGLLTVVAEGVPEAMCVELLDCVIYFLKTADTGEDASVLVVTPTNAQRKAIKKDRGENVKVRTVNKAQGQTADVVFMAFASPKWSDFAFELERVNVAMTRARCANVLIVSADSIAPTASSCKSEKVRRGYSHMVAFIKRSPTLLISSKDTQCKWLGRDDTDRMLHLQ